MSSGQALIEIGDPSALEVVIDVLSIDAVRLKKGTKILFRRWGGGALLDGVVRRIEPVGFTKVSVLGVEEQRVLIVADIVTPRNQWDRLGDGYTGQDYLLKSKKELVLGQWSLNILMIP